jgi:hypothetical protein
MESPMKPQTCMCELGRWLDDKIDRRDEQGNTNDYQEGSIKTSHKYCFDMLVLSYFCGLRGA